MLEDYGIIPLTGEACSLNMRILCDLTRSGCKVITDFFNTIPVEGSNWNSGYVDNPHVASVMIPRSCLQDLEQFAIHKCSCRKVHQMSGRTI
jgi:hypothetical protein